MATAVSDAIELAYYNSLKTIEAGATYENTPLDVVRMGEAGTALRPGLLIFNAELPREVPDEAPLLQDAYRMRCTAHWCLQKGLEESELKTRAATRFADLRRWLGANYAASSRVRNFFTEPREVVLVNEFPAVQLAWDALFYTTLDQPYAQG